MVNSFKIAVTASSLSTNPRQVPTIARALGIAGLMFDAFTPGFSIPELSQTGRREFRHLLSTQERELIGLRVDLGQKGLSPSADIDQQLRRLERAMDAAKGLAAPLMCVDLGPLPSPAKLKTSKPKVTPDMAGLIILPSASDVIETVESDEAQTPADLAFIAHLDAVMYELGQRADHYGVLVVFRSDLASLAALERTVLAAQCPWFGIDLDPAAMLRDTLDLDEVFTRVGPIVQHVRARDAILGSGHRTQPAIVGQGGVDWPHLLANLDAAGYHGWLTLDPVELPDRVGAVTAGATYFRGLK